MDHSEFTHLSDDELLDHLEDLARVERHDVAHFLGCLAAVDDRGAYKKRGFPSSFEYCTRQLRYSSDEAYRRVGVARAATLYPAIYSMLKDGTITLTGASRLAPHLTKENAATLLSRAENKSTRAIEEILASLFPERDTADRIRVLKSAPPTDCAALTAPPKSTEIACATGESRPESEAPCDSSHAVARPGSSSDRFEFRFTGSRSFQKSLERLKDILWHKYPSGRLEEILSEGLNDYLQRHDPQIRLLQDPAPTRHPASKKRRVPSWVRRIVWSRDQGRCAFVSAGGFRCQTRRGLEFDHVDPYSRGGRSDDPANIRLLCRSHNDFERRRKLGG